MLHSDLSYSHLFKSFHLMLILTPLSRCCFLLNNLHPLPELPVHVSSSKTCHDIFLSFFLPSFLSFFLSCIILPFSHSLSLHFIHSLSLCLLFVITIYQSFYLSFLLILGFFYQSLQAPAKTSTGQASWDMPWASRSMVIKCFISTALAAIVEPMKRGRYDRLMAYSLPPR